MHGLRVAQVGTLYQLLAAVVGAAGGGNGSSRWNTWFHELTAFTATGS
jgi:hypothetical protein